MISLEKCKEILNTQKKYSDCEIELIRAFLYELGLIELEIKNN